MAACVEQAPLDAERARLGDAPGLHALSAVTVAELPLALHHEDPAPRPGHGRGEGRAAEAAAYDGEVVQKRLR